MHDAACTSFIGQEMKPPDLARAASIFEDLGKSCMDKRLLQMNAKRHWLQAGFCLLGEIAPNQTDFGYSCRIDSVMIHVDLLRIVPFRFVPIRFVSAHVVLCRFVSALFVSFRFASIWFGLVWFARCGFG